MGKKDYNPRLLMAHVRLFKCKNAKEGAVFILECEKLSHAPYIAESTVSYDVIGYVLIQGYAALNSEVSEILKKWKSDFVFVFCFLLLKIFIGILISKLDIFHNECGS